MPDQRAPAPDVPYVSQVKSPPPTAEQEGVLAEFQNALDKLSESERRAREVGNRVGAEISRRKSIPNMRIPLVGKNAPPPPPPPPPKR